MLILKVSVLLVFILPYVTSERARIYLDRQQLLTSSTLAWQSPDILTHKKVTVGDSSIPWCRIKKNSFWVTGGVYNGRCKAPFLQSTVESLATQVLVSLNGFAVIDSVYWDRQEIFPRNAISSGSALLAYKEDPEIGILPGYVDINKRMGYFLKRNHIIKNDSAILLVEKEPSKYYLKNVAYMKEPHIIFVKDIVGEFIMENPSRFENVVTKTFSFSSVHSVYYGGVDGTVTGMATVVPSPYGGDTEVIWNRNNEENKMFTQEIKRLLPARSYINVSLLAVVRVLEAIYSGELTALFSGDVRVTKNISALHSETMLSELKGIFTGPFNLDNDLLLVTDHNTIETLVRYTTTTTTPSTMLESDTDQIYEVFNGTASHYGHIALAIFFPILFSFSNMNWYIFY